jgi:hypothetical protein
MSNADQTLIQAQEENFRTGLQMQAPFDTLKEMRLSTKKIKGDLQILLDQPTANKTGELQQ